MSLFEKINYRIALDLKKQMFMAYETKDPGKIGYGQTIEQAISALKATYEIKKQLA